MKALWHWLNRLLGRHKDVTKVELYSSVASGIYVTAHRCDVCGYGSIKITKEG